MFELTELKLYVTTFSPHLAYKTQALCHHITSPFAPGTIHVFSSKALRNIFCLLRTKSFINQNWSEWEIRGVLCFLLQFPTSAESHEESVKTKVTAFEISGQPAHQHLHLAPLYAWSGDLWPKCHLEGAPLTTKWDNCVPRQK